MSGWSAIVYGRTFVADRWWRALPRGLSPDHWAAKVMLDTVAGGRGLVLSRGSAKDEIVFTPRMLLARDKVGTLVGIACRVDQLDSETCQDEFGRDLYCFVGWFIDDPLTREIPHHAELAPVQGGWASAVYRRYTVPMWTTPEKELSITESDQGPAPWRVGTPLGPLDVPSDAPPGPSSPLAGTSRDYVLVWPKAHAASLWDLAVRKDGPFVLTTGWQQVRHARLKRITHLCADDVTKEAAVPRSTAQITREPETASGQKSVLDTARQTDSITSLRRQQEPAGRQPTREERPGKHKNSWGGLFADVWKAITGETDGSLGQETSKASGTAQTAEPLMFDPLTGRPAGEPPVEVELPKKRGSKKPFEGLDN
jgi:hypothetical protein